jgi:hypothetical protein
VRSIAHPDSSTETVVITDLIYFCYFFFLLLFNFLFVLIMLRDNSPPVRRPMKSSFSPQILNQPSCINFQPTVHSSYDLSPLLNLSPHYKGTPTENPYWHIREIVDLCKTQNVQGLTQDEIRLILFPFSLKDNAKIWYYSLAPGSIHTWDEMTTKFLKKFFPAHKTRQLRREILTFQQKNGALFFEAWEHFNELLLRCLNHNLSQEDQVLAFYEGLNDPNKSLVDLACGYMLMEKSSKEALELFETLSENSQQFPSKGRQGLKEKGIQEESTNGGIQAQMVAIENKLDMIMKAMINHNYALKSSLINLSQHYHEEEPSSTYWPQQYQEKEPPPVNWPQQYQEEECQSQFVANYNGQYMEDEYTFYLEQTTTTLRNEETVEENFCEPSLNDPLGERFNQFCEQAVVENQVDERKEKQTEDLEEPYQEKEERTKTFLTLAFIPETPRG